MFVQSDIDLARTENHAVDFVGRFYAAGLVGWVWDDPLEV